MNKILSALVGAVLALIILTSTASAQIPGVTLDPITDTLGVEAAGEYDCLTLSYAHKRMDHVYLEDFDVVAHTVNHMVIYPLESEVNCVGSYAVTGPFLAYYGGTVGANVSCTKSGETMTCSWSVPPTLEVAEVYFYIYIPNDAPEIDWPLTYSAWDLTWDFWPYNSFIAIVWNAVTGNP